jgi:hypothetical protein
MHKRKWQWLLEVVSTQTAQAHSSIMGEGKSMEVVDARHLFIKLLHQHGYYPKMIATICGMTPKGIYHVLANFDNRLANSRMLRENHQAVNRITQSV